ncbi:MAG: CAP domain-containing protein [Patescibacteria group bacterium]
MIKWLKKYFIPHEGNAHEPHFLRHETMTLLFLAIIVIELGFLVQSLVVFDKTKFLAAVLPGVLTTLTNEARAENNIPAVTENALLDQAANLKAADMAEKGYFAHTSPEGVTPWYWLGEVGYRYSAAGENLAVNFSDSADVARAWMNSPSHRANIVRSDFTEMGIGVASGTYQGRSTIFVAQFFGRPLLIAQSLPTSPPPPQAPAEQAAPAPTPAPSPVPTTTPPAVTSAPAPVTVLGEEATPVSVPAPKSIHTPARGALDEVLSSPKQSVTNILAIMLIVILVALVLASFIAAEKRHPLALLRGATLVAIIIFLLVLNTKLTSTTRVLLPEGTSANVVFALP